MESRYLGEMINEETVSESLEWEERTMWVVTSRFGSGCSREPKLMLKLLGVTGNWVTPGVRVA